MGSGAMIRGRVDSDLQLILPIAVRAGDGSFHGAEAVLDTGFDGCLSLPREFIDILGWEPDLPVNVTMADGTLAIWDTWDGQISWHGRVRDILVFEVEQAPLLGVKLFAGSQLTAQFRNGGEVSIEEL